MATKNKDKIPKGYYLKARVIQESDIAHAPPHVREIWDLILCNANHKDRKCGDTVIRRGQWLTSYKRIREMLHWKVGYRKCAYSKNDCETATRWLTKHTMVHTQKTTRGFIITVCNYDRYQTPANYETDTDSYTRHTMNIQSVDTTNKNEKELNKYSPNSDEFRLASLLLDLILRRKPDYRLGQPDKREKTLRSWAVYVDRMIRLDKRVPARIEAVIRWSQQDGFWQNNILSTAKLREKFDTLELKMPQTVQSPLKDLSNQRPSKEWLKEYERTQHAVSV